MPVGLHAQRLHRKYKGGTREALRTVRRASTLHSFASPRTTFNHWAGSITYTCLIVANFEPT